MKNSIFHRIVFYCRSPTLKFGILQPSLKGLIEIFLISTEGRLFWIRISDQILSDLQV